MPTNQVYLPSPLHKQPVLRRDTRLAVSKGRNLRCAGCRADASITAGTIFADTCLPLQTWFAAAWYASSQKPGVSALGLKRVLGLGKAAASGVSWCDKVVTCVTTRRVMAEIGVKELKATASAVIEAVEGGTSFVVTKRGRPAAVIMSIDEAEDIVLANADEYIRMRRAARTAYARGQSVALRDLD